MPVPLLLRLSSAIPSTLYIPLALTCAALTMLHLYAQGTSNTRLRNMHARTVLLTGGLTPLGITIVDSLAAQGAHLILLEPSLSSPEAQLLLPALQEKHRNPSIYVAECDLRSPRSVREFVGRFMEAGKARGEGEAGGGGRVDAIVLCGGYRWAEGSVVRSSSSRTRTTTAGAGEENPERKAASEPREEELGQFLLVMLLLPMLLRAAPGTRDVRVVNVVNPFYAAAFPGFPGLVLPSHEADVGGGEEQGRGKDGEGMQGEKDGQDAQKKKGEDDKLKTSRTPGPFQREGIRALRSIIWSVHLQRVLDALVPQPTQPTGPTNPPTPSDSPDNSAMPENEKRKEKEKGMRRKRRSNILSIAVCPGFSRADIVAPYLGASGPETSVLGILRYITLYPLLFLLLKSPLSAAQSVLYALYAPSAQLSPIPLSPSPSSASSPSSTAPSDPASRTEDTPPTPPREKETVRVRGGELYRECRPVRPPAGVEGWGGEAVGRGVWEVLEGGLRDWEEREEQACKEAEREKGRGGLTAVREE